MTDKRLVMTTAGSPTEARNLTNVLVERQIAACVTILPVFLVKPFYFHNSPQLSHRKATYNSRYPVSFTLSNLIF